MCGHVRRSLYVSPQGNVLPCMSNALLKQLKKKYQDI